MKMYIDGGEVSHCDTCGAYSENEFIASFPNGEDYCSKCIEQGGAAIMDDLLTLAGIPLTQPTVEYRLTNCANGGLLEISYTLPSGFCVESTVYVDKITGLK